jgi:hypothetical protein
LNLIIHLSKSRFALPRFSPVLPGSISSRRNFPPNAGKSTLSQEDGLIQIRHKLTPDKLIVQNFASPALADDLAIQIGSTASYCGVIKLDETNRFSFCVNRFLLNHP